VDHRREIREFLASRRAKLTPEQAGLSAGDGHRRVPGLRREEVAVLAGVSVDYYTRLERGNVRGVSDSVLDSVGRALKLDEAEQLHLYDLVRPAYTKAQAPERNACQEVRPAVQQILDAITAAPAVVRNGRLDVLAANQLGRALYSEMYVGHDGPSNYARFTFLDPRSKTFYGNWNRIADDSVALLRAERGRSPFDEVLRDLIDELCVRSEEFRVRWDARDVAVECATSKRLHHPVVGQLDLTFERFELSADPGLLMLVYSVEAGTPSDDAMKLLASWSAPLRDRS
jgi:transcriptional regulator with XRE-family HTH domain